MEELNLKLTKLEFTVSALVDNVKALFELCESNQKSMITLVKMVDERFRSIEERFTKVDARLDKIELRLDHIEVRLDQIEVRLDQIELRLDQMDARFDQMDTRLDQMDLRFDRMEERLDKVEATSETMQAQLNKLTSAMSANFDTVGLHLTRIISELFKIEITTRYEQDYQNMLIFKRD